MFLQKVRTSLLRLVLHHILRYFKYHIHSREKLKFHGISLFRPLAVYGEGVITLQRWARQTNVTSDFRGVSLLNTRHYDVQSLLNF
jgi:hypothetical protein